MLVFVASSLTHVEYQDRMGRRVVCGSTDLGGVPAIVCENAAAAELVTAYVDGKRAAWNAAGWPAAVWPNVVVDAELRAALVYAPVNVHPTGCGWED